MRRIFLVTALGLLATIPAAAQKPTKGTWEIGGFGRYNFYGSEFMVSDSTDKKWGFGGRVGYFVSPRWSVEADGSWNETAMDGTTFKHVRLNYLPIHLRAIYNAPISSKFQWLIGAGPGYNAYWITDTTAATYTKNKSVGAGGDFAIGALTGFRWVPIDWLSFRLDGTIDFIPSAKAPFLDRTAGQSSKSTTVAGIQGGVGVLLGGACKDKIDSIRVEPKSQEIFVGDQATFKVSGYRCDGQIVDVGAGSTGKASGGSLSGMSFTASQPGTYDISFSNPTARKKNTDAARVIVKERPKPPVVLDRCELVPSNSTVYPNGTVDYKVTGYFSDGTSRDLAEATLNTDGGTITGHTYKAPAKGTYTVTAQCGSGKMATATVTVRSIDITIRALFEFDKTKIFQKTELDSLRWLASQLKQFPTLELTLSGHTDWVGSVKYNEKLGMKRVKAVIDTLVSFGVDRARTEGWTKVSYGECQPIADNKTKAGRAQNRRVRIDDTPSAPKFDNGATCKEKP